jgi:hypothetical protein
MKVEKLDKALLIILLRRNEMFDFQIIDSRYVQIIIMLITCNN